MNDDLILCFCFVRELARGKNNVFLPCRYADTSTDFLSLYYFKRFSNLPWKILTYLLVIFLRPMYRLLLPYVHDGLIVQTKNCQGTKKVYKV